MSTRGNQILFLVALCLHHCHAMMLVKLLWKKVLKLSNVFFYFFIFMSGVYAWLVCAESVYRWSGAIFLLLMQFYHFINCSLIHWLRNRLINSEMHLYPVSELDTEIRKLHPFSKMLIKNESDQSFINLNQITEKTSCTQLPVLRLYVINLYTSS